MKIGEACYMSELFEATLATADGHCVSVGMASGGLVMNIRLVLPDGKPHVTSVCNEEMCKRLDSEDWVPHPAPPTLEGPDVPPPSKPAVEKEGTNGH